MPREFLEASYPPSGYEAITVSTSAVGLTPASIKRAAFITVETDEIRYRIDGTDPTSSEGHKVSSGGTLFFSNTKTLEQLKMIRVTNDATVRVTHYG